MSSASRSRVTLRILSVKRLSSRGNVRLRLRTRDWGGRCPVCGAQLYYVPGLNTYYCFNCKNYV